MLVDTRPVERRGLADAFAPITFARRTMPAEVWQAAEDRGRAWLEQHHDAGAELEYVALLGRGTRASGEPSA